MGPAASSAVGSGRWAMMHDLRRLPVEVRPDRTLRVKIIDACGLACTFCHNEGTPVSSDNAGRQAGQFTGTPGSSGRVSIYLATNGASFLPARKHELPSPQKAASQVMSDIGVWSPQSSRAISRMKSRDRSGDRDNSSNRSSCARYFASCASA